MDPVSLSTELLAFLFLVAVIAGLVDTLAGGGGLICLPALMLCGVPPLAALGTNKLQGTMGTATASWMMLKSKKVQWEQIKYPMLTAFLGAVAGTIAVQFIDAQTLSFVIPVVLVFILLYFAFSSRMHVGRGQAKVSATTYRRLVVPSIGCYDGMFGPGTGSFFTASGMVCRGKALLESTAWAKPLNFATNIASLIVFIVAGKVVWVIGLSMMVGQFIGAWAGARCLFKINAVYLRGIVIVVCASMLIKYLTSL